MFLRQECAYCDKCVANDSLVYLMNVAPLNCIVMFNWAIRSCDGAWFGQIACTEIDPLEVYSPILWTLMVDKQTIFCFKTTVYMIKLFIFNLFPFDILEY